MEKEVCIIIISILSNYIPSYSYDTSCILIYAINCVVSIPLWFDLFKGQVNSLPALYMKGISFLTFYTISS